MGEHPNIQRLKDGYKAFSSGDMEGVLNFFADDIVWHVPGRGPLSGDYKGKEEVLGFFGKLMELTEGSLKQEIHDMLANDTHSIALVRNHVEANGKVLDSNQVHVMHTNAEGQVTEFWGFNQNDYESDEFFS